MPLVQLKFRRDTAVDWTTANPVLGSAEPGVETDTRKWKLGDGATAWSLLPYQPTEDMILGGVATVTHGTTPSAPRPSGATLVLWVGTVAPSNAVTDDLWIDDSTSPATLRRFTGSAFEAISAAAGGLTTVAPVATASGALVAGKHNPIDATGGNRVMTLPTGQPAGTAISAERIDSASGNTVTITGNVRGTTGTTLSLLAPTPVTGSAPSRETLLFLADPNGSWWPIAGHKTKTWLDSTYASRYVTAASQANVARLAGKLRRGVESPNVLCVSDSTGNGTNRWPYQVLVALAALFPAVTVLYKPWNDTTLAYDTTVTVQTGTGSQTLTWFNCAISGTAPGHVIGSRWAAAIAATSPDLIFVNHGHNMGDPTINGGQVQLRVAMMSLTEEMAAIFPLAGIVMTAQNPTTLAGRLTWQALKASAWHDLAALRGYGYLDVHQAFLDYAAANGVTIDSLLADQVHPTDFASASIWAPIVLAALQGGSTAAVKSLGTPPLLTAARNFIGSNFDFNAFTAAVPDGFTTTLCTASKDTTNFETGAWGVQLDTTGQAAGTAYLAFTFTAAQLSAIKGYTSGQWVTAAVRLFVPSSNASTPSLIIVDQRGAAAQTRTDSLSDTRDRFVWLYAPIQLAASTTFLNVQVSPRVSGSASVQATVDRVLLVPGVLPNIGPATTSVTGPAGAAGSGAAFLLDHLSTLGSIPALTMASGGSAVGVSAANQAMAVKFRPQRNMTIALLEWLAATASSGNYDIGIYDNVGARLWSKGSTAFPATGILVTETVNPAVSLTAGTDYWLYFTLDNTTALVRGVLSSSADFGKLLDNSYNARTIGSAFPLPATLSPGATSGAKFPTVIFRES